MREVDLETAFSRGDAHLICGGFADAPVEDMQTVLWLDQSGVIDLTTARYLSSVTCSKVMQRSLSGATRSAARKSEGSAGCCRTSCMSCVPAAYSVPAARSQTSHSRGNYSSVRQT